MKLKNAYFPDCYIHVHVQKYISTGLMMYVLLEKKWIWKTCECIKNIFISILIIVYIY